MVFDDSLEDDYIASFDPHILMIVKAARRGDRSVLPELEAKLGEALRLFSNAHARIAPPPLDLTNKSPDEATAAFMAALAPMRLLDQLAAAAARIADPSLERVLKELSKCVGHEGIRNALAAVRANTPGETGTGQVSDLRLPGLGERSGDGPLATMVATKQFAAILDAVTDATIGDLLGGIAEAIRRNERYIADSLVNACQRYPEIDVFFAIRPWITDPDPARREAVSLALGRHGWDGPPPDQRLMDVLWRLLEDHEPQVVVAAVAGFGKRTGLAFSRMDLERLRSLCESHPSAVVRGAYSDVFYSPFVGGDHAPGALDAWCRLTADPDRWVKYYACARLDCFIDGRARRGDQAEKIKAALRVARLDASTNVRFVSLGGLTRLGEIHVDEIERELTVLAEWLEHRELRVRTEDDDDGLALILEMVCKPSRRYVPALERIARAVNAFNPDPCGWEALAKLLGDCREAARDGWLARLLPG